MMGLPRGIIADTPFLSIEDLERRFEDWDTPMEVPFAGYDRAYGPVVLNTGAAEGGNETVYVAAFDNLDAISTTPLSEPRTPNALLLVPRIAASLLPDTPPVVVAVAANGDSSLLFFDANGLAARTAFIPFPAATDQPMSAGDLNGDGLSDLIFGSGSGAALVLSDGAGGALSGEGVPSRSVTNFDGMLAGGTAWMECAVDGNGGSGSTRGRAVYGSSTP